MKELSIIIPILNEGKNIKILIPKINNIKKKLNLKKFEVILVDDDSSDNTINIVKNLQKKFKYLKIFYRKNLSKDLSKSCILGFNKSLYNNLLVMDGDLQHHPKYIILMFNLLHKTNSDLVIGCRDLFRENKGLSYFRRSFSLILIYLINILLGNKTLDPMSGFFIFKKKIFLKNKHNLYGKGYKILADIIYSSRHKLLINDLYINFDRRKKGKSKMSFKILIILISFMINRFIKNTLQKKFFY